MTEPPPAGASCPSTGTSPRKQVSFVAENINSLIATSPPLSPSTSTSHLPATDPASSDVFDARLLDSLHADAKVLAVNLERVLEELHGTLHGMTHATADSAETYRSGMTRTCDTIDVSIKAMYQLMARTEELTQRLRPISRLAQQIKEIRRVLDLFEAHLNRGVL